jgi:hypothetical protein
VGSTPHATNTWPLVLGGVVLGAVTGGWLAALIGSRPGHLPDLAMIPLALMGGTVGAAVGLFLGGLAGLAMRLLESQATGVAAAAVGVVIGSVTFVVGLQLGHTPDATQEALPTAGVLGLVAAAGAWWSRSRSRRHAERP